MELPSPFRVAVPEETLADLRDRLARTRFIDDFSERRWLGPTA